MPFTVAIVGRPNVGKSTLFNRLIGRALALVDDVPGSTRDRREGDAKLGDLTFRVIDTAGRDAARPTFRRPAAPRAATGDPGRQQGREHSRGRRGGGGVRARSRRAGVDFRRAWR